MSVDCFKFLLLSNIVNIMSYNPYKLKLFGVLSNF